MTNERYNELFRDMVLAGYCCGVTRPGEMICNYDRVFLGNCEETDEFINKAIVDIYSAIYCKDLSFTEANMYYDKDINGDK